MVTPVPEDKDAGSGSKSGMTMIQAINMALSRALADDPNVVVFGEDVGKKGGVFCATEGLLKRFGPLRVFDTPLSEQFIAGCAVGLGAEGIRAVGEFQFAGFIFPGFDQILNHASRLRNRTRGRLSCPIVFRAPYGAGCLAPEHHSESPEALFAHIPGLRVVIPSSPKKAYGLLLAAIHDPDPALFLEPIRLYRRNDIKENVVDDGSMLPLDTAFVLRGGAHVTLVSWGASLIETMAAANLLEQKGLSAEVIDVASITYCDTGTILRSVQKTRRCVVVHEAPLSNGFGAEIAARLSDEGFSYLKAPVKRVTGFDTIVPYPRLEEYYLPSAENIARTAIHLVKNGS